MCGGVRRPLSAFLRGFHELVPSHLLLSCGIDDKDLGLLLTGLPELNLHEWRANCDLAPCASIEAAAVVGHFFAALADFAPHDQVTYCSYLGLLLNYSLYNKELSFPLFTFQST